MKIVTIIGARPQFIKASAISRAILDYNKDNTNKITELIVHTGQHFDANMSSVFFEELDIPKPNYNLDIHGLTHGAMTGQMLEKTERVLFEEKPDIVLVYGDTNSTMAGALAASKLHIPLAHVEAGLRSHNLSMPEEVNRVLTDRVSSFLCCPTQAAIENLQIEGYPFSLPEKQTQKIENVGDVMYDVTLYYRDLAQQQISLNNWNIQEKKYALCTLHRAENTDNNERLQSIFTALRTISRKCPVVLPLHPRTHNILIQQNKLEWLDGLSIIDPVSYLQMQRLEMGAKVILTDSGGIQKEACFHNVPCITLRDETEWVETVNMGYNVLAGADEQAISHAWSLFQVPPDFTSLPYGDGNAAQKILAMLI
jgi:UDP-GlcNAc3NAcA epimerase